MGNSGLELERREGFSGLVAYVPILPRTYFVRFLQPRNIYPAGKISSKLLRLRSGENERKTCVKRPKEKGWQLSTHASGVYTGERVVLSSVTCVIPLPKPISGRERFLRHWLCGVFFAEWSRVCVTFQASYCSTRGGHVLHWRRPEAGQHVLHARNPGTHAIIAAKCMQMTQAE